MNGQDRDAGRDANRGGRWISSPYVMLAFLCAAAAAAYAQRQVIAVTKESIQADLELSKTQIGWIICLQQFLRAAGYVFFVSWFSTYLQETGAIGVDEAGWLNGLPLLAVVVGSPLGGIASDFVLARTGSRRLGQQLLAIVSLLFCAGCVMAALLVDRPTTATALISLGALAAAMCGPIGYAVTMQAGGRRVATAFAIMNMCGNFGATLFPIAAAALRTATGDWELVLAMFAGIYLAAAICWIFIDPD